jgi:hypothetical protein
MSHMNKLDSVVFRRAFKNSHYFQQASYNHNNKTLSVHWAIYTYKMGGGGGLCVMTSRLQCKEKHLAQSLNVVFSHCCITYDDF